MGGCALVLFLLVATALAVPAPSPILRKLDDGQRYQYVRGPDGTPHLVDLWASADDLQEAARYNPDRQNVYHLFTRQNPTESEPMLVGVPGLQRHTKYNPLRRNVMLLHDWMDSFHDGFNSYLIRTFLSAEDVNVIAVDWSEGAGTTNYAAAVANTVTSGKSVANFINLLNAETGSLPTKYHIVGHGLGGHMAGIVGRNVDGEVAYITALDPALLGWIKNSYKFRADDGAYTEVIHTNAGGQGYVAALGHSDFYPDGGRGMSGCNSSECDHARSYYYLGESITSGGFTGRRCGSYASALTGNCFLWGNLQMGGLVPKTGSSGIYYLETNPEPPFSRG